MWLAVLAACADPSGSSKEDTDAPADSEVADETDETDAPAPDTAPPPDTATPGTAAPPPDPGVVPPFSGRDGVYAGTLEVYAEEGGFALWTDTCVVPLAVTVDTNVSPAITGAATCTFTGQMSGT